MKHKHKSYTLWISVFLAACVMLQINTWRHQMETFAALLAICAGNSPVPGEFPTQRPVTRSFDVFFDMRLNKRLCKQSWGWWFETLSRLLWRNCNWYSAKRIPYCKPLALGQYQLQTCDIISLAVLLFTTTCETHPLQYEKISDAFSIDYASQLGL